MSHHPTETTLAAYAGGALPEAMGLVVATHIFGCPACRRVTALAETVGGTLLDDLPPAAMNDDALALVLARTERPVPPVIRPRLEEGLPSPLNACNFGPWRRLGRGLRWRALTDSGRIQAGLLEGAPGKALPRHSHAGLELTCVIAGSFRDGEQRYAAGDLAEVEGDHRHQPIIDGNVPCLCIVATDGVRFGGILGFAQRLLTD